MSNAEKARFRLIDEPILSRALTIDGLFTAIVGVLLIIGGWDRVATPSFAFIRDSGGPFLWGAVFLLGALGLALATRMSRRTLRAAVLVEAITHALFGGFFLLAALADPIVSFLGVTLFFWNTARLMNQWQALEPRGAE